MKWRTVIEIVGGVAMAAAIAVLSVSVANKDRHIADLRKTNAEQSTIIDSLLARRMKVIDVELNVTDKSKLNVYGKYNKGTISVPSERTYTLVIDSTKLR